MIQRYGAERVKKGLTYFLLGKAFSAGAGFLSIVLVVRMLPVAEFADYSVLVALVEVFTALSGLGIAHGMLRYVPELYVKHYRSALRRIVFGGLSVRAAFLVIALLLAWGLSGFAVPALALETGAAAFKAYLLVVLFRVTTYSLSQILESTLHQGTVQLAFTLSSVLRLIGMACLMYAGNATLLNVIWVEAGCDLIALVALFVGILKVVVFEKQASADREGDSSWLHTNLRDIVRFCAAGYLQHLAGLPFGGNTNRIVCSHLLSAQWMASFGFAQSLYEYAKRYLPAQLLVGLIRPVVVARYAATGDFSRVTKLADRITQANLFLQGFVFVMLGTAGRELLEAVSGGKYGVEARWTLLALMLVLTLETNRLILEVLAQTVERYAILIPSNLLLSASILPGIALVPMFGAKALPLCNALALMLANVWVKRRLAREGFYYRNDWRAFLVMVGLIAGAAAFGALLRSEGLHWMVAECLALLVFCVAGVVVRAKAMRELMQDFLHGSERVEAAEGVDVQRRSANPAALWVKIISMQRVRNYGSFMQAYALRRVIESYGHRVEFCDFRNGVPRHIGQKVVAGSFTGRLKKLPMVIANARVYMARTRFRDALSACFVEKVWPILGVHDKPDYDTRCDMLVVGSDEVFNYTQNHAFGYVPTLFGHGVAARHLISYAASAGYATSEDVEMDGMADELRSGFANFDHLAVRDENTFKLVEKYAGRKPELVIDPTLIYDFTPDVPGPVIAPGYLLVYAYEGRFNDPLQIATVRGLARHKGLRLVSIGSFQPWCDESIVLSPFEVLAAFRDATYVVTDTFHGSIFAIKFRKPFVSMLRRQSHLGSNSNKLEFLLRQLGLESRIVDDVAVIESKLDTPIDYAAVEACLAPLQERSRRYLTNCLAECVATAKPVDAGEGLLNVA